jgi:hypothetical protein
MGKGKRTSEKPPSKPLLRKAAKVLSDPKAKPVAKSLAGRVLGEGALAPKKGK